MAVSSDLELAEVLRRVVAAAAELVHARYAALGVLDQAGTGLSEFVTVGVDEETRADIGALPKGFGLLGLLISDPRPLRLANLREHPESIGFPPGHPAMTSFLGVPIRVRDKIFGNLYLTDKVTGGEFSAGDEELIMGLASFAGVAIENAWLFDSIRRREATLEAIQDIAAALLGGADPKETLKMLAARARTLVDADLATVALPWDDGETLAIEVIDGTAPEGIAFTPYPREGSISGEAIRTGEMVVLEDASRDSRWEQPQVNAGKIGPSVWLPLAAGGTMFGTLSVSRLVGERPFSPSELEVLRSFATQASIVLDHDRARQQLERLAMLEDEERIARDLHDTVIQRIFATGMSLQGALRTIDDPRAWERVNSAVDELDVTIRHIRAVIFGLAAAPSKAQSLRARALELSRELSRVLGFEPHVTFNGPVDSVVPDAVAEEMLATLREALSNVARHARASRVEVEVSARDDTLELAVLDNGSGIDPSVLASNPGRGLKNMGSRADRLGGRLDVERVPAGGTLLRWKASLSGA